MPLLLKTNVAEGATNGTTVTTTNSGGSGSNNFHSVTGAWTFSNAVTLQSGLSYYTTGGISALRWKSLGQTAKWEVKCWWRTTSIAVTSDIIKVVFDAAGATWIKFEFSNSANRFRIKNNVATLGTGAIAPAINTTYRFRFVGDNSAGTITAYIYNSALTLLDTLTFTSIACPKMVYTDFGPNVTSGTPAYFDGIEVWDNESYAYTAPGDGNSLRVSVGQFGTDRPRIDIAPTQNLLIGLWTKPYIITASPLQSGNHEIMCAGGSYWQVENITDNISGNVHTDGNIDSFNQNTQFYASKTSGGTLNWANDYTEYYNPGLITETLYRDWKFSMWQIILDTANSRFIFRQWIKWGLTGAVEKTGESIVTWASIRTNLQNNSGWTSGEAAAWVPDNLNHIYLGDSSAGGTLWDNIVHCKVKDQLTEPTLSEISTLAMNFDSDTSVWAHWKLSWSGGFPDLLDYSGNNRNMYDEGTIRQGEVFTGGASVAVAAVTAINTPGTWTLIGSTVKTGYIFFPPGVRDTYMMTVRDPGGAAPTSPANDNERVPVISGQRFDFGATGSDIYVMSSTGASSAILWKTS